MRKSEEGGKYTVISQTRDRNLSDPTIFVVRSTRGMSLGAGCGSRSLAGLSCLGGGGGGLNRGKRAGAAFFWESWATRV